jgi:hypothetical protein
MAHRLHLRPLQIRLRPRRPDHHRLLRQTWLSLIRLRPRRFMSRFRPRHSMARFGLEGITIVGMAIGAGATAITIILDSLEWRPSDAGWRYNHSTAESVAAHQE